MYSENAMNSLKLTMLIVGVLAASFGASQQKMNPGRPSTADEILGEAMLKAGKEKKNIFVIFHASWCGWCKRLDAFMQDKEFRPIFERSYVVVHLTVLENPDKKHLENGGAEAKMKGWGGENAGLPFFLVLDAKGKKIVDSLRPSNFPPKEGVRPPNPDPRPAVGTDKPQNTGHPMAPEEVAWFMEMLYRSAPHMTDAETAKIEAWLKAQKK